MNLHHTEDWRSLRRAAYPPQEDFADAMYWASRGDTSKLDAYYAACDTVKLRIPKPETAPPD